jgi:hypothetical protein
VKKPAVKLTPISGMAPATGVEAGKSTRATTPVPAGTAAGTVVQEAPSSAKKNCDRAGKMKARLVKQGHTTGKALRRAVPPAETRPVKLPPPSTLPVKNPSMKPPR